LNPIDLTRAGIEWLRNEAGSLVSVRGPASLVEQVKTMVAQRVPSMADLAPREGARWGACERCGVAMDAHRGGWCELCCLARRVALKAKGVSL